MQDFQQFPEQHAAWNPFLLQAPVGKDCRFLRQGRNEHQYRHPRQEDGLPALVSECWPRYLVGPASPGRRPDSTKFLAGSRCETRSQAVPRDSRPVRSVWCPHTSVKVPFIPQNFLLSCPLPHLWHTMAIFFLLLFLA